MESVNISDLLSKCLKRRVEVKQKQHSNKEFTQFYEGMSTAYGEIINELLDIGLGKPETYKDINNNNKVF